MAMLPLVMMLLSPSLVGALVAKPAFLALGSDRGLSSTQALRIGQNLSDLPTVFSVVPHKFSDKEVADQATDPCKQGETRAACTSPPLHAICEWRRNSCVALPEVEGRQQAQAICVNMRRDMCVGDTDKLRGMPKDWRCRWQENGCVADSICTKWENRQLFHENFVIMWMLGISGTLECATKLGGGCSVGSGWHCITALILATCCCCCCCYPCLEALSDDDLRRKMSEMPCLQGSSDAAAEGADDARSPFFETGREQSPPDPRHADDVVYNCDATDDWHELGKFECESTLVALLVKCNWKDQGWGESKARLRTTLLRGSEELASEDTFGLCAREPTENGYQAVERTFQPTSALIRLARQGDSIKFEYTVGSGDGHVVHMRYFEALPNYGTGFHSGPGGNNSGANSHA